MTAFEERFEALRQHFVGAAEADAHLLEKSLTEQDALKIRRIAHGLAGRSGMFGYRELGQIALAVDEAKGPSVFEECARLIDALRQLGQVE